MFVLDLGMSNLWGRLCVDWNWNAKAFKMTWKGECVAYAMHKARLWGMLLSGMNVTM